MAADGSLGLRGEMSEGSWNTPTASQTEIKVEKVTHNWTVKNFSHCYQEYLENFVQLRKGDDTLTWSVKIYPKGNGENNKDFVFLCLNRVANNSAGGGGASAAGSSGAAATAAAAGKFGKIGFKSRFFMRTVEGKDIEMRVHPNPSHSDYVSYIKRDVLFPQILPQDVIVVSVEIDVAVETVTTNNEDAFPVRTISFHSYHFVPFCSVPFRSANRCQLSTLSIRSLRFASGARLGPAATDRLPEAAQRRRLLGFRDQDRAA